VLLYSDVTVTRFDLFDLFKFNIVLTCKKNGFSDLIDCYFFIFNHKLSIIVLIDIHSLELEFIHLDFYKFVVNYEISCVKQYRNSNSFKKNKDFFMKTKSFFTTTKLC
jgi:hypothetical protein